jgi:outer membrane immunogenic protein
MTRLQVALLVAAAVVGFDVSAFAADMPTKMPIKVPPVVGYAWDGFYLGGYVGSVLGQNTAGTPQPGNPAGTRAGGFQFNDLNFTGGVTAGYNWTLAPNWLVGLEGDIGYFALYRNFKEWNDVITAGTESNWNGTARVRGGYLTGPSLLYVTGGVAFVHMTDIFGGDLINIRETRSSTMEVGWVAGAGIETKLSRSWSAKTEYLFIDTGNRTFGSNPFGVGVAPGSGGLVPTDYDHRYYHVIKTGLNYNFGGGGADEGLPFINAPMLPSDHHWGGLYAGVNVGVGASNSYAESPVPPNAPSYRGVEDINGAGFAGGAQIGYNYMITPRYFVGIEGDFGYLGMRFSNNDWFDVQDDFTQNTSWYGTARVRVGASNGPALFYFTGGAAWVHLEDGFGKTTVANPGDLAWRTATGWTFGGGTEVALNARWSAKLESLYIDAGNFLHNDTIPTAFVANFKERFFVVRAGLNYKLTD